MSRFNNPRALTAAAPVGAAAPILDPVAPVFADVPETPEPGAQDPAAIVIPEVQPTGLHKFCFVVLCLYLISAIANEFSFRLLHNKAYISTVTIVFLPILFLMTGGPIHALQSTVAKWYLAFGVWLGICAPFSVWKGGTAKELVDFYLKSFLICFVICACVLRLRELKTLMSVLALNTLLTLLICALVGSVEEGRFAVHDAGFSFLGNANELSFSLTLGMLVLLFHMSGRRRVWRRIFIAFFVLLSLYFAFKTASRGGLLTVVVTILAAILMSKHRLRLALLCGALIPIFLILIPPATRSRLLFLDIGRTDTANAGLMSALESAQQRESLLGDSIEMTLRHPIFGAGPGVFMVANVATKEAANQQAVWLNPHNTYTQISSEAGIPGAIFFIGTIVACVRMNYRTQKRTRGVKGLEPYAALSTCMYLSIIAFAVGAIFDQFAYANYLPIIAGISSANNLAVRPYLDSLKRPSVDQAAISETAS